MTGTFRRVAAILVSLAVAVLLVMLFRDHQREVAQEAEREAPVVAPSRIGSAEGAALVTLDSAEARRVGLQVAALRPASGRSEERLPAEVVPESERTAALRAPVAGRFTVPAGTHWPGLGERVAAGVALAQVSDARPLSLPIGGVVTRVGAQPGALVEAGQTLLEVADYSRPLVRVVWLEQAGAAPVRRLSLSAGEGAPLVDARLVGPAPEADPVTRRPAYLYRAAHAWPGATPGTPVEAIVPGQAGPASEGVLVPDPAVVQWEGLAWAYRQRAPGRFERARVTTSRPAPGGWIAGAPFAPGDSVVVRGAEELLSEEFRARVTVGDESGE
jgi:biotin carboxyl carrier protein